MSGLSQAWGMVGGNLPAVPPVPEELLEGLPPPFQRLADAVQAGLRPDTSMTVTEWAEANRSLQGKGAAEPGPYRVARTPFIREVADSLSPSHPAQRVTLMKGSQVGGTEAGNCWLGFIIANAPGPIIAVMPTVELAKRFSKQRVDPLVAGAPVLRQKVKSPRARDSGNTVLQKEFPGGVLVMTGANSAVGLRSMPARYAFLDEVDAYPPDAGDEGDPVALAEARTKTYGYRKKIFLCSTPKLAADSRIAREYEASDQRRYFVPCPHCQHMQWLRFVNLRWEKGRPATAAYHCEACGAAATEADKTAMLAAGEWRATATPQNPLWIGFHVSSLYSPVGWMSWVDIAADWEKAVAAGTEAMRTFKNSTLGEVWQEEGEAPDWERLLERREPFTMGTVPARAVVLTAAVDNQAAPERLEVAVWAWAPGFESWLVDTQAFDGSPGAAETWDKARPMFDRLWPREDGTAMRIARIGVDTGGQHTAGVYAQLRRLRDERLMPLKGVPGWARASPVNGPTFIDLTLGGRKIKRGLKLWTVAVDVFKSELYRRLWLGRGEAAGFPPGWVHLSEGLDAERVKQLVAEQLVTIRDRRGFSRQEWQKTRANEQLDLAVYARAALSALGADRYGEGFWKRAPENFPVVEMPPPPAPGHPPPTPKAPLTQEERRMSRLSRLSMATRGPIGPVTLSPTSEGPTVTVLGQKPPRRMA